MEEKAMLLQLVLKNVKLFSGSFAGISFSFHPEYFGKGTVLFC